jgi:hypothetical protein
MVEKQARESSSCLVSVNLVCSVFRALSLGFLENGFLGVVSLVSEFGESLLALNCQKTQPRLLVLNQPSNEANKRILSKPGAVKPRDSRMERGFRFPRQNRILDSTTKSEHWCGSGECSNHHGDGHRSKRSLQHESSVDIRANQ